MKIAVTMANYNHGHYVEESVEAILAQTYRDWELVIVDDGSTDGSWGVIEKVARRDPRIRAERLPENRGIEAAVMYALSLCNGELYLPRAADNPLCSETFFEKGVAGLRKYPGAASIAGALLVPSPYEQLRISNGVAAMREYERFLKMPASPERDDLYDDLIRYCNTDTEVMIKLWNTLVA